MSFSWTQSTSSADKAQLTEGYHKVKAVKVMRYKKDGTEIVSRQGVPQVYVVLGNSHGEESLVSFTLNDKAGWKLAQFLKASGANLEKMDADGVKPEAFADESFAIKQLADRECWVYVSPNGKYVNVDYIDESDVPPMVLKEGGDAKPVAADSEDVPF